MVEDILYGRFELDEVLGKLIQTDAVQRLKGIHQGGGTYLIHPEIQTTRYEHSVGVMLLIKLLGGSVAEQIAGLLHDVSHTAFSHVADYVFNYEGEDYHEKIQEAVVFNSDIPQVLKAYGFDIEQILDEHCWSILEQPSPLLCADRVDYTLRDMYLQNQISLEAIQQFIQSIQIIGGKMVLSTIEAAEWFTEVYYKEVLDFFNEPYSLFANRQLTETLKYALAIGTLQSHDFLNTDEAVIQKLKEANNDKINHMLVMIHKNQKVTLDDTVYDFSVKQKARIINPLVKIGDIIKPSSELSPKIVEMNTYAKERFNKGVFVRIQN